MYTRQLLWHVHFISCQQPRCTVCPLWDRHTLTPGSCRQGGDDKGLAGGSWTVCWSSCELRRLSQDGVSAPGITAAPSTELHELLPWGFLLVTDTHVNTHRHTCCQDSDVLYADNAHSQGSRVLSRRHLSSGWRHKRVKATKHFRGWCGVNRCVRHYCVCVTET